MESAPAWVFLTVLGACLLLEKTRRGAWSGGSFIRWVMLITVVGSLVYFIPQRGLSYRWRSEDLEVSALPAPEQDGESLVFVHGGWTTRLWARLAAAGMSMDSVETVIRRNGSCRIQRYLDAMGEGGETPTTIRLEREPIPGYPTGMRTLSLPSGYRFRLDPTQPFTPACEREAAADAIGVIELSPLLWQDGLPGLGGNALLLARDMGPQRNRLLLDRFPERTPFLYLPLGQGRPPSLVQYRQGMEMLWNGR